MVLSEEADKQSIPSPLSSTALRNISNANLLVCLSLSAEAHQQLAHWALQDALACCRSKKPPTPDPLKGQAALWDCRQVVKDSRKPL